MLGGKQTKSAVAPVCAKVDGGGELKYYAVLIQRKLLIMLGAHTAHTVRNACGCYNRATKHPLMRFPCPLADDHPKTSPKDQCTARVAYLGRNREV